MSLEKLFSEAMYERGCEPPAKLGELLAAFREGHLCLPSGETFPLFARLETHIAHSLLDILSQKVPILELPPRPDLLTDEQWSAVQTGLASKLTLLTGGPGTGKSFTIASLCKAAAAHHPLSIAVAAPTGKAASLLGSTLSQLENTTVSTGTLHALLGVRSQNDVNVKPLYIGADIIIVDECSMVDVFMWKALLSAASPKSRLILVGDTNQLPPVEAGSIFQDIASYLQEVHPECCVHLSKCLRSESQEIIALSDAICEGDDSKAVALLQSGSHIGFTTELSPPEPANKILAAMKEGEYGVHSINSYFSTRYKDVQPIIITRSNKELGLYNGENGVLKEGFAYFGDRMIPQALLPAYDLAFCLSIHKSQGSEYDHVCVVLAPGAEQFGKQLLYTAVTRAKKSLSIFGSEEVLRACIRENKTRKSGLREKLLCPEKPRG